jgi:hypothetical protein
MLRYAPPAYRPAVSSPTIRRQPRRLVLSQTFDQYFSWPPAAGDVVRLVFHSATAVLGFHVYKNDTGFFKWFGLLLGVGQSVGAVCDALSLIQRAAGTHPPEGTAPAANPNA